MDNGKEQVSGTMGGIDSRVIESDDYSLKLSEDGGFNFSSEHGGEVDFSPIQIVEGWSKWKEEKIDLDIFSNSRGPWDVSYSGQGIEFTGTSIEKKFIIDNHKNTDGDNIFVTSEKIEFEFDHEKKYKIRFRTKCTTNDEKTVKLTISPYVLFFDEEGKEIGRQKHFCNLRIDGGWDEEILNFTPPEFTKMFSLGIFLNSFYKINIQFDAAELNQFTPPENKPMSGKDWVVKRVTSGRVVEWKGHNRDISTKIVISGGEGNGTFRVSNKIKFKRRLKIDRISIDVKFNEMISKLLNRSLEWKGVPVGTSVIDRWTPIFFQTSTGNGMIQKSGFGSVEISNDEAYGRVILNIIDIRDSPNFYFDEDGSNIFDLEQEFEKGDEIFAESTLSIGKSRIPIFPSRGKDFSEASFVMTHHADATTRETFDAVMQGTSDRDSPDFGKSGLIGRGLSSTWSVFSESVKNTISDWEIVRCAEGTEIIFPDEGDDFCGLVEFDSTETAGDLHNLIRSVEYPVETGSHKHPLKTEFQIEGEERDMEGIKYSILVDYFDSRNNQIERAKKEILLEIDSEGVVADFAIPREAESLHVLIFLNKEMRTRFRIRGLKIHIGNKEILPSYIHEGKKKVEFLAEGLDSEDFVESIRKCPVENLELVLHTATHYADDRQAVDNALGRISEFGPRNWIDHSLSSGVPSSGLKSQGWNPYSDFYIMDLFEREGYEYAWSYIDDEVEGMNQLRPTSSGLHTPIIFQHKSLKCGKNSLWQWSTYRPPIKTLFEYVNEENLKSLVQKRGISLLHEYFSHQTRQEGYMFHEKGGEFVISQRLDGLFSHISNMVEDGVLWNPTIAEYADYIRSLENVHLEWFDSEVIINNEGEKIEGFSLWIHREIKSSNISVNGELLESLLDSMEEYEKFCFNLNHGETRVKIVFED